MNRLAEPFTVVTDAPAAVDGLFRIAFDADGVVATLPPPRWGEHHSRDQS